MSATETMQAPPLPANEAERLQAIRDYNIVDTPPEQAFDDLTWIASQICGTPMALVSLVEQDRQWFKSKVGITASETSRDVSFCAHAILQRDVFVVEDAWQDPRFQHNPLVTGDPHIRFYASVPLTADGEYALGTLCVLDRVPRTLTPEQTEALRALARQVQAQLDLRRSSARLSRLAAIVEHSDDAILSKSLEGVITSWNPAAAEMYGYFEGEALGQHISMLAPPECHDEVPRILEVVRAGEALAHLETTHVRKDGSRVEVSLTVSPIRNGDSRVVAASVIARDISERLRAEREVKHALQIQMAANEQLERTNARMSSFVSIVSHEFRTPLTVIQGFSEMISREALEPEEIREFAGDIYKESSRLSRMINDMLDLNRMESGKVTLNLSEVDLNAVIADIVYTTRPLAIQHTIQLALDSALPHPMADADHIRQVILNLLSNAIKYSRPGGTITLSSRPHEKGVHVAVRDQGQGLPPEAIERVFDPYWRVEQYRERRVEGTGLGLPIARQIVQMHGGHIWAESSPGEGSMFQFTLPLVPPKGAEHLTSAMVKLLFCEDDLTIQKLIRVTLRASPHQIRIASDGLEGLEMIERDPPDIIFTDVCMPRMDGMELCRTIRARPDLAHIPVVLITASVQGTQIKEGYRNGASDHLAKPFTMDQLRSKVEQYASPATRLRI